MWPNAWRSSGSETRLAMTRESLSSEGSTRITTLFLHSIWVNVSTAQAARVTTANERKRYWRSVLVGSPELRALWLPDAAIYPTLGPLSQAPVTTDFAMIRILSLQREESWVPGSG